MPRLQLQPRGLIPGISLGREPSNSTGGTFTPVASGFPGALLSPAVEIQKTLTHPSGAYLNIYKVLIDNK